MMEPIDAGVSRAIRQRVRPVDGEPDQVRVLNEPSSEPGRTSGPALSMNDLSDRAVISVAQCAELLGTGRSATYEAVRHAQIPSVKVGRRTLIPVPGLLRWLGSCDEKAIGSEPDNSEAPSPTRSSVTAELEIK